MAKKLAWSPVLQEARVVLDVARLAGIDVEVRDGTLKLTASTEPPAALIERLRQNKAGIIALLTPGPDGWSPDDWRGFYEERAAIAEHDGGVSRDKAEAQAYECCIAEWLIRNFVPSPPGRCAQCGRVEQKGDVLIPHGTRQSGHVWLHDGCWERWHDGQIAVARAALAEMGIGP